MSRAVDWNVHDTVRKFALEVARVAHEGLGSTEFERLRTAFNQKVEQENSDLESQIRAVTRLLVAKTTTQQSVADVQTGGLCLMWLANTRVGEWSMLQLFEWGGED